MPKIKREDDFEDFEDEEEEEEVDEDDELEMRERERETKTKQLKPISKTISKPKEVKRRYGLVAPTPLRLIDTESNEIIGEGEGLIYTTLAEILERLERIEVRIGAITS